MKYEVTVQAVSLGHVTVEADSPEKAEPEDKGSVSLRKVGDFYEMYGKNAEIGAEVLGLRMLSKNGSPMVGFPNHVKDEYSAKLREAGYTVLIEQAFELNPPKREAEKLRAACVNKGRFAKKVIFIGIRTVFDKADDLLPVRLITDITDIGNADRFLVFENCFLKL